MYLTSYQVSFIAVINNNGIEITRIQMSSFTYTTNSTTKTYGYNYTSAVYNPSNASDNVISTNYRVLNISYNSSDTSLYYNNGHSGVHVSAGFLLPINSTLSNITLDVVVFRKSKIQTVMTPLNYYFEVSIISIPSINKSIIRSPENAASNVFAFTGYNGGSVMNNFQFGYDINQPNLSVSDF